MQQLTEKQAVEAVNIAKGELSRYPQELELMCLNDGRTRPFSKDGGNLEKRPHRSNPKKFEVVLQYTHGRTTQLHKALEKRTANGYPMFVALEPVDPAYPGDVYCTPDETGRPAAIPLVIPGTEQGDAILAEAKALAGKRAVELALGAVGELSKAGQGASKEDAELAKKLADEAKAKAKAEAEKLVADAKAEAEAKQKEQAKPSKKPAK